MPDSNIEKEIEDVLDRLDHFLPEESRLTRLRRALGDRFADFRHSLSDLLSHISLGQLMIASFLLIVLAYVFRFYIPGIARYLIIAGLLLFFGSFFLSLISSTSRTRYEKRWRGKVIDLSSPSWSARIRNWFRRERRRR